MEIDEKQIIKQNIIDLENLAMELEQAKQFFQQQNIKRDVNGKLTKDCMVIAEIDKYTRTLLEYDIHIDSIKDKAKEYQELLLEANNE